MNTLKSTLSTRPADNSLEKSARIESLRQQVAAGTYHVDANALADALIRHLQKEPRRRVA